MAKSLDARSKKDKEKPLIVNGISYASEKELQERIKADAKVMAEFLYDVYKESKQKSNLQK